MRVKTKTGSIYAIDHVEKKIRREPTQLMKTINPLPLDGHWKPYLDITEIIVGLPIIAHYDMANMPLHEETPEGEDPVLITTNVVEILNDGN